MGGWAQLGKRPRRRAGGEVRVRIADGHVVVVVLGDALIEPVSRRADEIARALPRARRREQLALALAAVGVVGWAATLAREIVA